MTKEPKATTFVVAFGFQSIVLLYIESNGDHSTVFYADAAGGLCAPL